MNQEELDTILAEYLMVFGKDVLYQESFAPGEPDWMSTKTPSGTFVLLYKRMKDRLEYLERERS